LDEIQVNWKPGASRWSIGDCVDHLATTNEAILSKVRDATASARRRGRTASGPFRYGRLARWFLEQIGPPAPERTRAQGAMRATPRRRMRAPRRYRPRPHHEAAALAARFARVQDDVLTALGESEGLNLARIRARSPALGLLRIPVGIWFASMAAHEARHLEQARAVRADARFPAPLPKG
jgi:hypothetical protein